MPKLSENSLEKRFTCHYCDKSFRTRQGLSGHIQYKHAPYNKKSNAVDMATDLKLKLTTWEICSKTFGFPQQATQEGDQLIRRWIIMRHYFHILGIELDDKDFKYFMLQHFDYKA